MSKATLSPRSQVLETVRGWIESGRIAPGTRLPAEQGIAEELGVARGTVRSALRELVRLGVLVAVARRGYRTASTETAGIGNGAVLLVSYLDSAAVRNTGVDAGFEVGTFRAARLAGRTVLALGAERMLDGGSALLGQGRPLGAVIDHETANGAYGPAIIAALRGRGIPCVVHGDAEGLAGCDRVVSDNAAGAALLVRGLLAAGRRRILPVWSTPTRPYWLREREAGIATALAGAEALPAVVLPALQTRVIDDREVLEMRMRQYLGFLVDHLAGPHPVDAILATTDCDVFPLAMACRRLGREPGRDVVIAGYDGYWRSCWERIADPYEPWATIDRDNESLGEAAIRLLVERIADPEAPPRRRAVTPRLLIT